MLFLFLQSVLCFSTLRVLVHAAAFIWMINTQPPAPAQNAHCDYHIAGAMHTIIVQYWLKQTWLLPFQKPQKKPLLKCSKDTSNESFSDPSRYFPSNEHHYIWFIPVSHLTVGQGIEGYYLNSCRGPFTHIVKASTIPSSSISPCTLMANEYLLMSGWIW